MWERVISLIIYKSEHREIITTSAVFVSTQPSIHGYELITEQPVHYICTTCVNIKQREFPVKLQEDYLLSTTRAPAGDRRMVADVTLSVGSLVPWGEMNRYFDNRYVELGKLACDIHNLPLLSHTPV